MSKAWKGWMHPSGFCHPEYATPCTAIGCKPALVQPIDDESLPHPGDGKEWEGCDIMGRWHPVTILGAPHEDSDGSMWVVLLWIDGDTDLVDVATLRERKPEPEHEAPTVADAIRIAKKMHGVTRISREDNDFAIRFRHCGRWWRCAAVGMGFLVEEAGDGFLRSNKDAKEIQDTMEALWHQDERRSSDERRKGERRSDWPHDVSFFDRRRSGGNRLMARRGRRSDIGRRSS